MDLPSPLHRLRVSPPAAAAAAAFAALGSVATLRQAEIFELRTWDLAHYVQALGNTLRGEPLRYTFELFRLRTPNILAMRFAPGLILFLPAYALLRNPLTLELIQVIGLALTGLAINSFSSRLGKREALYLQISYYMHPMTVGTLLHSFHPYSLFSLSLIPAVAAAEAGRRGTALVLLLLSLTSSDAAPLLVGSYSLGRAAADRDRWWLLPLAAAAAYQVAILAAISHLGGRLEESYFFLGWGGGSGSGHPARTLAEAAYFPLVLSAPAAMAPLLEPHLMLPVFSWAAASILLSSGSAYPGESAVSYLLSPASHYSCFLLPFVYLAAVPGLERMGHRFGRDRVRAALALSLAAAAALSGVHAGARVNQLYGPGPFSEETREAFWRLSSLVPADASLFVDPETAWALADRPTAYSVLYPLWDPPEYALIVMRTSRYRGPPPSAPEGWGSYDDLISSGTYGLLACDSGVYLLKKGYSGPPLEVSGLPGPVRLEEEGAEARGMTAYSAVLRPEPGEYSARGNCTFVWMDGLGRASVGRRANVTRHEYLRVLAVCPPGEDPEVELERPLIPTIFSGDLLYCSNGRRVSGIPGGRMAYCCSAGASDPDPEVLVVGSTRTPTVCEVHVHLGEEGECVTVFGGGFEEVIALFSPGGP